MASGWACSGHDFRGLFRIVKPHQYRKGFRDLGGRGWIVTPEGEVLALTSPEQPFVTADLDLNSSEEAGLTQNTSLSESPDDAPVNTLPITYKELVGAFDLNSRCAVSREHSEN